MVSHYFLKDVGGTRGTVPWRAYHFLGELPLRQMAERHRRAALKGPCPGTFWADSGPMWASHLPLRVLRPSGDPVVRSPGCYMLALCARLFLCTGTVLPSYCWELSRRPPALICGETGLQRLRREAWHLQGHRAPEVSPW